MDFQKRKVTWLGIWMHYLEPITFQVKHNSTASLVTTPVTQRMHYATQEMDVSRKCPHQVLHSNEDVIFIQYIFHIST